MGKYQIFVGLFRGNKSVGIYSIAFVLAGAWCIMPTTLIMSYMTSIYNINIENKYEYIKLTNKVLFNIIILSLIIVILLEFSAYYIVTFYMVMNILNLLKF